MYDSEDLLLYKQITEAISRNPRLIELFQRALAEGAQLAISNAEKRNAELDIALRCALILIKSERVSAEVKHLCSQKLASIIDHPGTSPIEKQFVADVASMTTKPDEASNVVD